MHVVRFALALPHYGFSMPDGRAPSLADIVALARDAERLGFDRVYVSDHLFLDIEKYGGPPGRYGTPEAFGMLHAIAAATERIQIGTLVLCSPFRVPAVLASQVRTIQEASNGRFVCGLGAGWYEPEFKEAGLEFGTAGSRIASMRETASMLREAGDAPRFIGGKGGAKILEAVARDADGWNVCWRATPDHVSERRDALHAICRELGRDPNQVEVTVGLYTLLGRDREDLVDRYRNMQAWTPGGAIDEVSLERWAEGGLVGTIDEAASTVRSFADAGVSEMIVCPASLPFAMFEREQLDLASELAGALR